MYWCGCASARRDASIAAICATHPGFSGRCWKRQSRATSLPTSRCATSRSTVLTRGTICDPCHCWGGRPHGIACQSWGCEHPTREPSMTQYKRIGIDTSKAVFTLHGIDHNDKPVLRINLRRPQLVRFFRKLPATEIVLEACGAAYHWARELSAIGHQVRLIPPQYVKPFVKRGKNDRNDAGAVCE